VARFVRTIGWLAFAVVAVIAAIAMIDNRAPATVHFLDWQSSEAPLYWWLVGAFVSGCACGAAFVGLSALRARLAARRARTELAKSQTALEAARRTTPASTG
jgi:uncharacterized integral membrane protein